jgi:hypothetical protein
MAQQQVRILLTVWRKRRHTVAAAKGNPFRDAESPNGTVLTSHLRPNRLLP